MKTIIVSKRRVAGRTLTTKVCPHCGTQFEVRDDNPSLLEKHEHWGLMVLDLANPAMKVGVEVDGVSHNTNVVRLRDRKKDRLLENAGWRVLRVKNEAILNDPVGVALQIISCLEVSAWLL